ncbi:MAG: RNA polymerase sigma factor [Ferrimicrobium sp.]
MGAVASSGGQPRPSFDEILRRTYSASSRLALKIIGDAEGVADVLQEAYLSVFRGLERFRGDARYETWVYRIVANASMGHLRAHNRLRRRECSFEDVPQEPAVAPAVDASVDAIDLVALLAELPEQMREILLLRYGCGYSIRQIAGEISISESAVKVRLFRARHRVMELCLVSADALEDDV